MKLKETMIMIIFLKRFLRMDHPFLVHGGLCMLGLVVFFYDACDWWLGDVLGELTCEQQTKQWIV